MSRYLLVVNGKSAGMKIPLVPVEGSLVLGGGRACPIRLQDEAIGGEQAEFYWDAEGVEIADLGSGVGVFLNEKKLERTEGLRPGDQIRNGNTTLTLIDPNSPPSRSAQWAANIFRTQQKKWEERLSRMQSARNKQRARRALDAWERGLDLLRELLEMKDSR